MQQHQLELQYPREVQCFIKTDIYRAVQCAFCKNRSGAKELQRIPLLISFNVLEWGNGFTLGLNAANNADYIEKRFK